jgi:tetratricopeptide (TPR) repeat protein
MKSNKKNNLIIVLTIILFAFILYGNIIKNDYSFDDDFVTNTAPLIKKGIKGIPQIFTSLYSDRNKLEYGYRPIAKSTFAVEYQLFGLNPHISHLINILIYAFTGIFLFFLLKKLLKNYNILFPLAITLLFLAHPVHTEVVCCLKNREDLLSFLFSIIALWYFIKYTESGSAQATKNKKIRNILLGLLSFIIAYLSKKNAVTFLIIIPLVIYFFTNTSLKKTILLFGLLIITVILVIFIPKLYLPVINSQKFFWQNPLFFENNFLIKFSTGMNVMLFYLKLLIFPHPLIYYYGYNMLPVVNWSNVWVIISFIFHLSIFIYAIINFKKKHILSFAILYYLITISVFSNILIPIACIVGERLIYFSSLGFCIILAFLLFKITKTDIHKDYIPFKKNNKIIILLVIILIPYSIKTIYRNKDWKDYITLYKHDIKYNIKSVKANELYAGALMINAKNNIVKLNRDVQNRTKNNIETEQAKKQIKQDVELSIKHFKQAIKIYPLHTSSLNNLGLIYLKNYNQYNKAVYYFKKAIDASPENYMAYANLAYSYQMLKDYKKAIKYYKKSIDLNPKFTGAISMLANLYNELGNFENAVDLNKKIIEIDNTTDKPYVNLGNYFLMKSDTVTAVFYWEKAIEKMPVNYRLCINLSRYFRQTGNLKKADIYYKKAIKAQKIINKRMTGQ